MHKIFQHLLAQSISGFKDRLVMSAMKERRQKGRAQEPERVPLCSEGSKFNPWHLQLIKKKRFQKDLQGINRSLLQLLNKYSKSKNVLY